MTWLALNSIACLCVYKEMKVAVFFFHGSINSSSSSLLAPSQTNVCPSFSEDFLCVGLAVVHSCIVVENPVTSTNKGEHAKVGNKKNRTQKHCISCLALLLLSWMMIKFTIINSNLIEFHLPLLTFVLYIFPFSSLFSFETKWVSKEEVSPSKGNHQSDHMNKVIRLIVAQLLLLLLLKDGVSY